VDNIPAESSIYLQKKDANGTPLAGVQVLLEYSVDNSATWHPIRGRSESDPIQTGFCDAALLNRDGSMTTDANGTIRFTGLRQDTQLQEIRYRVTEIQTVNGCTLLPEAIWIGHLPMDINGESVGDLSVTVTNGPGFALPRTGTCQTPGWVLAGSCTGTLGLWTTCYFIVRKKRRTHFGKDN
jgi:hypothetical protein